MERNERTDKIVEDRMKQYNTIPGARVGDWIREKDGRMTRTTYDWNETGEDTETIQHGGSEFGGYYLGAGYISYSGSLDSGFKKNQLRDTGEVKNGRVWVFKDDFWGAGRGVDYTVQFRVFEVV